MRKKKFRTEEEEIEALRREPEFKALMKDLKSQTTEQMERLQTWFEEPVEEDGSGEDHGREREDS